MSWYGEWFLPRMVDRTCGGAELAPWRRRVTDGLAGVVVEIGFGSGTNLRHLPDAVREVLAVEPSAGARDLAEPRIRDAPVPVRWVGLDGDRIDLPDGAAVAGLATFVLCTVPDPRATLAELFRIIRPGGHLHLLEHGLSPDPGVARWQRRLDPIERRLAGGCHLTRIPERLIVDAGFEPLVLETGYGPGPRPWTWFTTAMARRH
ncbi:MAG: class I SAM-dependent methyltransferase [Acidimicrobiales bacterium]